LSIPVGSDHVTIAPHWPGELGTVKLFGRPMIVGGWLSTTATVKVQVLLFVPSKAL
jgi:hypothetical protein